MRKIKFDKCIIGTGKSGIDFSSKLAKEYDLPTEAKSVQLGVRFEAPQKYFQKLIDISYDFKLYQNLIMIKYLYVHSVLIIMQLMLLLKKLMVMYSYNGHAKKGEEYRNDMTNFGILMEIKGIENPFEWCREVVSKVQRVGIVSGEGVNGKRAQGRYNAKYKAGLYYSPSYKDKSLTSEGDWVKAHYIDDKEL
jgi:uncharacterized FAD-dependent dehydrogenase